MSAKPIRRQLLDADSRYWPDSAVESAVKWMPLLVPMVAAVLAALVCFIGFEVL